MEQLYCTRSLLVFLLIAHTGVWTDDSLHCEELNGRKTISLTLETEIKLMFELEHNDTTSHHLDLITGRGDIALRVTTRRYSSDTRQIEVKVLSLKNTSNGMVTVGRDDKANIKSGRGVTITISIQQRKFAVMCEGALLSKDHSFPFQTVQSIKTEIDGETITVCNKQDRCDRVCLTCPPGCQLMTLAPSTSTSPSSYNNTHECVECEAGTFTNKDNEEHCSNCIAGTYSTMGKDSCTSCPRGKFAKDQGSNRCISCHTRTYSNKIGSDSCKICGAGSETDLIGPGSKSCNKCKEGTFSAGQTSCQQCLNGTIAPAKGLSECVECSYRAVNTTNCTCPPGHILRDIRQCEPCPTGTVTEDITKCLECVGTVVNGKCQCKAWHTWTNGKCVPVDCPIGTKIVSPHKICEVCPPGSYGPNVNSVTCPSCPTGHYQPLSGQRECLPCPAGYIQGVLGSTSCTECPKQTYQPTEGSATCLECIGAVVKNTCHKIKIRHCNTEVKDFPSIGNFTWLSTPVGTIVHKKCPLGGGEATRECLKTGWSPGKYAQCDSIMSKAIDKIIEIDYKDPIQHSQALLDAVTGKSELLGIKDIVKVSQCFSEIQVVNVKSAENIVGIIAEVSNYRLPLSNSLDKLTKSRYVMALEDSIKYLTKNTNNDDVTYLSNDNIEINIVSNGKELIMKNQAVRVDKDTAFSTVIYKNSKFFEEDNQTIISSNIFGVNSAEEVQVRMDFALYVGGIHECRWYDTESYRWRKDGCYISVASVNMLQCHCDHLTSFAIFTSLDPVPEADRKAQSILTTVLFTVSIIGLIVTLGVYLPLRSLRSKVIVQVELQQIISLLLANIMFLILSNVTHQSKVCTALVLAVQYLYLVTMAWSLAASWTFYGQIVQAIHTYGKSYKNSFLISFLSCWIIPAVFPAFAYSYSITHGLDYVAGIDGEYGCWIEELWKTYTFIIPLLAIVALNFLLGLRIVHVMLKAATRKENKMDAYKRQLKSIFSLMTLFGTAFLLALFTKGPQAVYVQYLFIALTCTQGFWIFVFFVPLRPDVQKEWITYLSDLSGKSGTWSSSKTEASIFSTSRFSSLRKISVFYRPEKMKTYPDPATSTEKIVG